MGTVLRKYSGELAQVIGMYRQVDGVFKPIVKVLRKGGDGVFNTIAFGTASVPSFADATYEELDLIASSGNASSYWSIGDTRTLTLSTGETIELRIEDFAHDNLVGGGKAGVTIGTTQLLDDQAYMNLTATNDGGWTSSNMRTVVMPALFDTLPSGLQAIIKPVTKVTQAGGGSSDLSSTADSLWLYSYTEVGGVAAAYSPGDEGSLYPLYDTNDSATRIKARTSGADAIWWFRSPYLGDTSSFTYATATGSFYRNRANISGRYISFGFCIGGSLQLDAWILDYAESFGNSYSRIDYIPVYGDKIEYEFEPTEEGAYFNFGVRVTSSSKGYSLISTPSHGYVGYGGATIYSSDIKSTLNEVHTVKMSKGGVFLDDVQVSYISSEEDAAHNMVIGALGSGSNTAVDGRNAIAKHRSFTVHSEDDVLKHRILAVVKDDVCQLYDNATDTYYPSLADEYGEGNKIGYTKDGVAYNMDGTPMFPTQLVD